MNTEDLAIFTEIYKTHSISVTASNTFQTQSTVSKRLAVLEKELQCVLFERGRGRAEVTATIAGDQLYPIATRILALSEKAETLCRQSRKQKLRIAVVDSIGSYYLSPFLSELTSSRADWEIELIVSDSRLICEMVRDNSADVGIVNGGPFFAELEVKEILSEKFMVYTKNPALLGKKLVGLAHLNPASEVFHVYGNEYNEWHHSVIREGSAKGKVNLAHLAVALCQEDEDWTILPASVAGTLIGDKRYIHELDVTGLRRRGYLVTHRNSGRRDLLAEFEELLKAWKERNC